MKQAIDVLAAYHAFARAVIAVAARVAREQHGRAMVKSQTSRPLPPKEKAG